MEGDKVAMARIGRELMIFDSNALIDGHLSPFDATWNGRDGQLVCGQCGAHYELTPGVVRDGRVRDL